MRHTKLLIALSAIGFTASAYATNGMNMEGYGPIATGMGGASMAYDNGVAAAMNNPATLGFMSSAARLDLAVGMLGPDVTSKTTGMADAASSGDAYYMPAVGYARKSGQITYGVAMFAQGGMGTDYSANSFLSAGSGLPTRSELGVGRLIAPLAYEVNSNFTVGGSLDFVWAMMDLQMAMSGAQFADMVGALGGSQTYGTATGTMVNGLVGAFGGADGNPMTPADAFVSNVDWTYFDFSNSNDYTGKTRATGFAGKIGFTYKVSPQLTIGGVYHSKTSLGDMKGDASLQMQVDTGPMGSAMFGAGMDNQSNIPMTISGKIKIVDFQWPETFGLGMAYQANDEWLIAVDYKRINWADVMKNFKMTFTADNVPANGAFAGAEMDATLFQDWDDQNVLQVGASYKANKQLTFRIGANFANNPVPDKYLNPLFPAIEKRHYTLGVGYAFDPATEVNFSYQIAPNVNQTNAVGVTSSHSQTSWQFMYSKRF